MQFLILRKNTCIIQEQEIQEKLDEKEGVKSNKAINVLMIDIEWLMQSGGFLELPLKLNKSDNEAVFKTEFVNKVLEEFWDE